MPLGSGPVTAAQQLEAVVETGRDLRNAHGADARRRQLDGQRQPVEAIDDARHRHRIQIGIGADGPRPAREQRDGVVVGQLAEGHHPLGADAQRRPARRQDAQVARRHQQEGDERGHRLQHVLAVVEHEQGGTRVELLGHPAAHVRLLRRREGMATGDRATHTECGADLRYHVAAVRDADELHDVDARQGGVARQHLGDPRLADPARSQDGRQPPGRQGGAKPLEVVLAPEERVAVEEQAGAHRSVRGEQLLVQPLELRCRIGPQPISQLETIGVIARQRRRCADDRRLAPQQRHQHRDVVAHAVVGARQRTECLLGPSRRRQCESAEPSNAGREEGRLREQLGTRTGLTGCVGRAAEQLLGPRAGSQCV